MFVSAIKKAHDAVEGVAVEAAFGLTAILLACVAFLFAAAGAAFWLATVMPAYFALLITAAATGLIALCVYALGRRSGPAAEEEATANTETASPLASITKSLSSMGAPLDIVASGLFARQFKKAPLATVAATAAVGALLGMMVEAKLDDD